MRILSSVNKMQELAAEIRKDGKTISFVPTMGALHEGHLSLVREARKRADVCVVSIFVNPAQFGPNEDYMKYARDLDGDIKKLEKFSIHLVFIPETEEIYPEDFQTFVEVEKLENHLCGLYRKGHFRGVATIVLKLFNIVKPHIAIFGEKDYQQLKVIQRMVKDLNIDIDIVSCPIVRDKSGLALSSRNSYLSTDEKESARSVFKTLLKMKEEFDMGSNLSKTIKEMGGKILKESDIFDIDYLEICDPETLASKDLAERGDLLAIAVRLGSTRLIDHIRL
ncbi:MAG: pantoate--beta-alanine ligase [Deltaproteobacteria bacterium]|nr:pantoate--beta-alanine ligase [Deltaproteobacteria bacterium]